MNRPIWGSVAVADLARAGQLGDEMSDIGGVFDLMSARPAWQADAACREHPELTWFPARGQDCGPALEVCRGCLVVEECRAWALAQGPELKGLWGGLSELQRRLSRAA